MYYTISRRQGYGKRLIGIMRQETVAFLRYDAADQMLRRRVQNETKMRAVTYNTNLMLRNTKQLISTSD